MYPSKKDNWIRFLDFAYNLPLDVLLAMNLTSLPVSFLNVLMNLNFRYKSSISCFLLLNYKKRCQDTTQNETFIYEYGTSQSYYFLNIKPTFI